jgi:hypothetical protein
MWRLAAWHGVLTCSANNGHQVKQHAATVLAPGRTAPNVADERSGSHGCGAGTDNPAGRCAPATRPRPGAALPVNTARPGGHPRRGGAGPMIDEPLTDPTGDTALISGGTMLIHQQSSLPDDAGATKSAIPPHDVAWVARAAGTCYGAGRAGSPSTGHPGEGTATSTTSSAVGATMPRDSRRGAGRRG